MNTDMVIVERFDDAYIRVNYDRIRNHSFFNGEYHILYGNDGMIDEKTDKIPYGFNDQKTFKELTKRYSKLELYILNTNTVPLKFAFESKSRDLEVIRYTIDIEAKLNILILEKCRSLCKTDPKNRGHDTFRASDLSESISDDLRTRFDHSFSEYNAEDIWKDERDIISIVSADVESQLSRTRSELIYAVKGICVISNGYRDRIDQETQDERRRAAELKKAENDAAIMKIRSEQELAEARLQQELKRISAESERIDEETRLINEKKAREIRELEEIESEKRRKKLLKVQAENAENERRIAEADAEKKRIQQMMREREDRWMDIIRTYSVKASVFGGEIHENLTDIDEFGISYDGNGASIHGYTGDSSSVLIPAEFKTGNGIIRIDSIGPRVFEGKRVTSITIEEGITTVGPNAFSGCSELTDISLPKTIRIIGNDAFKNCMKLTSIHIPDSIEHIGKNAFCGCFLKKISIPAGFELPDGTVPRRCTIERR